MTNLHRPVDISWIAERSPEVHGALQFYLRGDISYEDALKLAIEGLYNSLVNTQRELVKEHDESPYLSRDTLDRLRKGEFLP